MPGAVRGFFVPAIGTAIAIVLQLLLAMLRSDAGFVNVLVVLTALLFVALPLLIGLSEHARARREGLDDYARGLVVGMIVWCIIPVAIVVAGLFWIVSLFR